MKRVLGILCLGIVAGLVSNAGAAIVSFTVPLDGAQEAPGPGDPDGIGTAFLEIDTEALTIDWDLTAENIAFPLTGAHIHEAPFGVPGPIVVDFSSQLSGANLMDPDLAGILANPANYYVNLHNAYYPNGAIRGQIPEPATVSLLALGLAGLVARRKAARR